MQNKALLIIAAVVIIGGFLLYSSTQKSSVKKDEKPAQKETMTEAEAEQEIQLINHLQADLPEQDVFIVGDSADEVIRVEKKDAEDEATRDRDAYATAQMTEHDPFKVGKNPLGPFAAGKKLGFTLGEWLAASGTGTYSLEDDKATIVFTAQKLVPDGVYTVWCSRVKFPPEPAVTDKPCGAADGSQNTFTADADGNAKFTVKTAPLEKSTKEEVSVVALAYHSDGKTYGAEPGEFGKLSHVHIFWILPAEEK